MPDANAMRELPHGSMTESECNISISKTSQFLPFFQQKVKGKPYSSSHQEKRPHGFAVGSASVLSAALAFISDVS